MSLIAANLIVLGTAIYSRIERASRGDSVTQDTEVDHRTNFTQAVTGLSESSQATKSTSGDPRHHMSAFITELDMISSYDHSPDPSNCAGDGDPMLGAAKVGDGGVCKRLLDDGEGTSFPNAIKEPIDPYFR